MVNIFRNLSGRKAHEKERPDYYITPTRDFTKYTKDCEEKYWSKETAFDWSQSVSNNLRKHLAERDEESFLKIAFATLSMIAETLEEKIISIQHAHLPVEEDALKAIAECIPFDMHTIERALTSQVPLSNLHLSV